MLIRDVLTLMVQFLCLTIWTQQETPFHKSNTRSFSRITPIISHIEIKLQYSLTRKLGRCVGLQIDLDGSGLFRMYWPTAVNRSTVTPHSLLHVGTRGQILQPIRSHPKPLKGQLFFARCFFGGGGGGDASWYFDGYLVCNKG